eukprot:GHVR01019946.1.p1 GENE.GHVR01019946.1~~GHVR01019946.1.p1  ORF type:complete len:346 (+),score=62.17 GHVR01019946.1:1033-2070(+)
MCSYIYIYIYICVGVLSTNEGVVNTRRVVNFVVANARQIALASKWYNFEANFNNFSYLGNDIISLWEGGHNVRRPSIDEDPRQEFDSVMASAMTASGIVIRHVFGHPAMASIVGTPLLEMMSKFIENKSHLGTLITTEYLDIVGMRSVSTKLDRLSYLLIGGHDINISSFATLLKLDVGEKIPYASLFLFELWGPKRKTTNKNKNKIESRKLRGSQTNKNKKNNKEEDKSEDVEINNSIASDDDDDSQVVVVLYNGRMLPQPLCNGRTLCPVDLFLHGIDVHLPLKSWNRACRWGETLDASEFAESPEDVAATEQELALATDAILSAMNDVKTGKPKEYNSIVEF